MADLRSLKKHEVFLILKRYLVMVILFSLFLFIFLFTKCSCCFLLLSLSLFFFNYFFINAIQAMHMDEELVSDSHK